MKTPIPEVRELCAHVSHLCDYVASTNPLADPEVLLAKAKIVKQLVGRLYGDAPTSVVPVNEDITDLL